MDGASSIAGRSGPRLVHLSEDPSITRFVPRPAATLSGGPPVVWAIDDDRAPHYWFPRDCPRIVFWADRDTSTADSTRFLGHGGAGKVIAVESAWLGRIRNATLYAYALPPATFRLVDDQAGYYVSAEPVEPLGVAPVGDLLDRLLGQGIELRITPRLWPLRDALVSSTMGFSMIRLRNATAGKPPSHPAR